MVHRDVCLHGGKRHQGEVKDVAVSCAGPGMEMLLFHSANILGREVWTRAGDLVEKLPKSLSFPNICSGLGRQSESINIDEMYVCR